MGIGSGKHARDPSSEEGDGGPTSMKSPQTTPGKKPKVSVTAGAKSPSHSPGSPSRSAHLQPVGDDRDGGGGHGGKENFEIDKEEASTSSALAHSKHPVRHGGELIQVDEEEILPGHHTPVRMETRPKAMEPLTPLVINENEDVTMRHSGHPHHQPQATSTPATTNGHGQHIVAPMPFNHEMRKSSSHTGSSAVRIVSDLPDPGHKALVDKKNVSISIPDRLDVEPLNDDDDDAPESIWSETELLEKASSVFVIPQRKSEVTACYRKTRAVSANALYRQLRSEKMRSRGARKPERVIFETDYQCKLLASVMGVSYVVVSAVLIYAWSRVREQFA